VPITGNIEVDDAAEAGVMQNVFRTAEDLVRKTMGTEYRATLVFVTEDQCQEFIKAIGWKQYQEDQDSPYYDGVAIAKSLGVTVAPECIPFRGQHVDRALVEGVGIIPQELNHDDV
jgi:hypothetical protein